MENFDRVSAELAIRNRIAKVAHTADFGALEEYREHFAENARWEFPGAPRIGREDIVEGAKQRRAEGVTGPQSHTRHVLTTIAVDVHDESSASVDSYFLFFRTTDSQPSLFNMGHYHDTFVVEDGQWRIDVRTITLG